MYVTREKDGGGGGLELRIHFFVSIVFSSMPFVCVTYLAWHRGIFPV